MIGSNLGRYKLVFRAIPTLGAPFLIVLAESSLEKLFLSLAISESRFLFTPLLCSGEVSDLGIFNSTPLPAQKKIRITRVFWTSVLYI